MRNKHVLGWCFILGGLARPRPELTIDTAQKYTSEEDLLIYTCSIYEHTLETRNPFPQQDFPPVCRMSHSQMALTAFQSWLSKFYELWGSSLALRIRKLEPVIPLASVEHQPRREQHDIVINRQYDIVANNTFPRHSISLITRSWLGELPTFLSLHCAKWVLKKSIWPH